MTVCDLGDVRRDRCRVDGPVRVESRIIHGYRRVFRVAGSGPPLEDVCASTQPSVWGVDQWRELLRSGRPAAVRHSESTTCTDEPRAVSERSAT